MSYRLSKIVTRTGDDGSTQLGPGERISKDDIAIEALGTLDELNSAIGIVLAYQPKNKEIIDCLTDVQHDLFTIGGELCPPHRRAITEEKISRLDEILTHWNDSLPPLKEFILPGGNHLSASCHLARTICRRAERCLVALNKKNKINPDSLRYINRLSDLLFIAARILAKETDSAEPMWENKKEKAPK